MVPKPGGKSDNFAVTTDEQWKLGLPNTLDQDGTVSEMNRCNALVFGIDSLPGMPESLLGIAKPREGGTPKDIG